jgi:nucleoside-diphosphate-sugar epimerase
MIQEKNKIRVLVTGSSGFIGSYLVKELIKREWEVNVLIRESTDTTWLSNQKLNFKQGDYSRVESLKLAVSDMDYIFHLGAIINAQQWETFYDVNALGTKNLLTACACSNPGLKKFIFVSSIAASGPSIKGKLKTEVDQCLPTSLYGKSKWAAEKFVHEYMDLFPAVIIRPSNVLGFGQKELTTMIKLVKKRIFPQLGNGDKQTSICFVEDVVAGLIVAAESEKSTGKTYFITDNNQYSWRELINEIAQNLKVTPYVFKVPYPILYLIGLISDLVAQVLRTSPLVSRSDMVSTRKLYWLFSNEKIKRELGFVTRVDFREGIKDIIDKSVKAGII